MRKVVYNACFGGFSLSPAALLLLWERGMKEIGTHVDEYWPPAERAKDDERWPTMGYAASLDKWRKFLRNPNAAEEGMFGRWITTFSPDEKYVLNGGREVPRDHPEVVRVVEELGDKANGACAKLKIVEIPDDVDWHVEEYDGSEHIAENHRTWP